MEKVTRCLLRHDLNISVSRVFCPAGWNGFRAVPKKFRCSFEKPFCAVSRRGIVDRRKKTMA